MAFIGQEFVAAELPQGNEFEPLPAGMYDAKITEADIKTTKSGTGQYIKIKYDILGPTHQGRCVFGNLNIKNDNLKAEEIGRQQFGELMRAAGLARVTDTDQLIGATLQIKLAVRAADAQFPASNDVKGFKPMATAQLPASAPAATPKSSPPWAKR